MAHSWKFFRAGGFDQVKITSGADLANLDQLDQKLWVALACPTRGVEFDTKTLDLIDLDKDGRIRAPELIAAAKWAVASLKNPDDLLKSPASLALAAINDATPEGKQLLASAKQILANLGKGTATAITIEDTTDTVKIFAQTVFNGDGIVPVDSAADDATKGVIIDILTCYGAVNDRSGKPGIDQAKLDAFLADATAFDSWHKAAEASAATVLPLGANTEAAYGAFKAVKAKVDDYFARCRLAGFDPRALGALNRKEEEYLVLAAKDLSITASEVSGFPLARIEAGRALPLKDGINPAWAAAVTALAASVVKPILGDKAALTESEWTAISGKFGAFEVWAAGKAGAGVEKLGLARVRAILAGNAKDTITALIAKDKALEPEANAIVAVDKLVRLNRDLFKLANNFVAFRDFYSRQDKAIFQAGTLYLDQRSCDLCLTVEDAGKHAAMAGLAGSYLAYCDCFRKGTGEKMSIVAAFTGGDSDNLMVGRNGIFYDRKGRDWDATITKIVDNPISIRQAFWSPYKKVVRMIEELIAKRAAAADAAANTQLAAGATTVATADKAKPEPKKIDVGAVAAMGVAFGAIGGALATLATGVMKLEPWQIPLVFLGIILVISGPSMLIAWLKLRKRNLGPILDANGWAVNAKAKLNVPFGGSLTGVAALPPGAQIDVSDKYAEKSSVWPKVLLFLFLVWWVFAIVDSLGLIYQWSDQKFGHMTEAQKAEKDKATPKKELPAPAVDATKVGADVKAAAAAAAKK
ncbi:MAG: hypothetical protein HY301_03960 [Verrucomicrobia bacterium]|nr:hypothetical protein [Verrucomicrobiota bacterium]